MKRTPVELTTRRRASLVVPIVVALLASVMVVAGLVIEPAAAAGEARDGRRVDPRELVAAAGEPAGGTRSAGVDVSHLGSGDEPATYLVELEAPPVPEYTGGEPGLAPTRPGPGKKLDADSAAAKKYDEHLEHEQADAIDAIEAAIGRQVDVPFTYQFAANAFAVVLTPAEARTVATQPGVLSIARDQPREAQTDAGPQTIGADHLWNGVADLNLPSEYRGEGVVVGIVDSGANPFHPSFADVGADGYDHTNPRGRFYGACDPDNARQFIPGYPCNDKLIGAYSFFGPGTTPNDFYLHGSSVGSTAAGNVLEDVVVETPTGPMPPLDISGVAPHTNVISYRGCCGSQGRLVAAIEQAIVDEVDVINYSVAAVNAREPWLELDAVAFLAARAAGIFVSTGAANEGPASATIANPANAPWVSSAGATTHARHNDNRLTGLVRDGGASLPDLVGSGTTTGLATPAPLVSAASVGDPLCEDDAGHESAFAGAIVVCASTDDSFVGSSRAS